MKIAAVLALALSLLTLSFGECRPTVHRDVVH